MALTVQQYIELRAIQYAGDARLPDYVDLATMLTGTCYGERRNYAIALRVLHYLTLETMRGAAAGTILSGTDSGSAVAGLVTSEKEGDLSRSYENPTASDSGSNGSSKTERYGDLPKTEYGLELIELMNNSLVFARTRIMLTC
jgi:hypothetical protein